MKNSAFCSSALCGNHFDSYRERISHFKQVLPKFLYFLKFILSKFCSKVLWKGKHGLKVDILMKIISMLYYIKENILQSVRYLVLLHTKMCLLNNILRVCMSFLKKSPSNVQVEINFRSETLETDSTPHQ